MPPQLRGALLMSGLERKAEQPLSGRCAGKETHDEKLWFAVYPLCPAKRGFAQSLRLRLLVSDEGKLKTRGPRGVDYASEWPILLRRTLLLICPRGVECVDAKL